MSLPYEILIRANDDHTFKGAHAVDEPNGIPRPLTLQDLADIAPAINAATLEALTAANQRADDKSAEASKHAAAMASAEAAILDASLDDAATLEVIKAAVEESKLSDREKQLAEIDQQIAELEAKRGELAGTESATAEVTK